MNEQARDLEGWTIAFDLDGTLVETAPGPDRHAEPDAGGARHSAHAG